MHLVVSVGGVIDPNRLHSHCRGKDQYDRVIDHLAAIGREVDPEADAGNAIEYRFVASAHPPIVKTTVSPVAR
jgi:hypothetical protein